MFVQHVFLIAARKQGFGAAILIFMIFLGTFGRQHQTSGTVMVEYLTIVFDTSESLFSWNAQLRPGFNFFTDCLR